MSQGYRQLFSLQNVALQSELRGIQKEITALGEQQKHVITELRKQLTAAKVLKFRIAKVQKSAKKLINR